MKIFNIFFALLLVLGLATGADAQDLWEFTDTKVLYTDTGNFPLGTALINGDNTVFVSDNLRENNEEINFVFVNDSIISDPLDVDVEGKYSRDFLMTYNMESLVIAGHTNTDNTSFSEKEDKIVIRNFDSLGVTNTIHFRFMKKSERSVRDIKIHGDSVFILLSGITGDSYVEKTHGGGNSSGTDGAGTLTGSGDRSSLLIFDMTTDSILTEQHVIEIENIKFCEGSLVVNEEFIYFATYRQDSSELTVHKLDRNFSPVESVRIPWFTSNGYNRPFPLNIRIDENDNEILFVYHNKYPLRISTKNMEVLESPPVDIFGKDFAISSSVVVGINYIDNAYITTLSSSHSDGRGSWVQRFESDNGFRSVGKALVIRDSNGDYYAQANLLSSTVIDGRLKVLAILPQAGRGRELFVNGVSISDDTRSSTYAIVFETYINVNSSTGPVDQGYKSISSPQATHSIIGPGNVITHYGVNDLTAVNVDRVLESGGTIYMGPEANPIDFVENSLLNSLVVKEVDCRFTCYETYVNYLERAVQRAPNPDSVNLAPVFADVIPESLQVRENENFSLILSALDLNNDDSLSYDIDDSFDSRHFILDDSVLRFFETHDFENPSDENGDNIYDVGLRVTDRDNLFDNIVISIRVTGQSDEDPVVNDTSILVLENELSVGMIVATDADFDSVFYSLIGDSYGIFDIDSISGLLSLREVLDYDDPLVDTIYQLSVKVRDASGASDTANVAVRLIGINNNSPVVNDTSISVLENELNVGMIVATDADFDSVFYSLIGDSYGIFDIDSISGLLSLREVLDYDDPLVDTIYQLSVKVRDASGASDTANIAVRLIGINDNSPVISYPSGNNRTSIEENTSFITTITVGDLDLPNDEVSIDVVGLLADLFSINTMGELSFIESPDYENPEVGTDNVYTVTIRATDRGGNETLGDFVVEVTDVEDGPLSVTNISPNPTYGAGNLNIDCVVCQIEIFDINGRIVRDYYYSGTSINISSLPNGIYVIVVVRKGTVSNHRIVKN